MAAAEEVLCLLSLICTKGEGATGLTARMQMQGGDLVWVSGHGFHSSPLSALSNDLGKCSHRERSWSVLIRCGGLRQLLQDEGSCFSPVGPGHPIPGEFLRIAVQMSAHHTDTSVCKQQSHPCFPAWDASCSKLCCFGLSLVLQEAFRPIKSLRIIFQLFAPWLWVCLCCLPAACLYINCLKHTQHKIQLSSRDHTLPRRGKAISSGFTVPGSQGNKFPIEPFILQVSKHFAKSGPVGKQSYYLCDQYKVLHRALNAHERWERM